MSPNAMPPAKLWCIWLDFVGLELWAAKNPPPERGSSETGDSEVALGVSSKSPSSGMKFGIATPFAFLVVKYEVLAGAC